MMWLVITESGHIDWEDTWALLALRLAMVVAVVGIVSIATCTVYDYRNEWPIETACRAKGYTWMDSERGSRCVQITPVTP